MRRLSKALLALGLIAVATGAFLMLARRTSDSTYHEPDSVDAILKREADAESRIRNNVEPSPDMLRLAPTAILTGTWSSDANIWNCNTGFRCVQVDFASEENKIKASWLVSYDKASDQHVEVRLLNEAAANLFIYKPLLHALQKEEGHDAAAPASAKPKEVEDWPDLDVGPPMFIQGSCPTEGRTCLMYISRAYAFARLGKPPKIYGTDIMYNDKGWWSVQRYIGKAPANVALCPLKAPCWIVSLTSTDARNGFPSWRFVDEGLGNNWTAFDLASLQKADMEYEARQEEQK